MNIYRDEDYLDLRGDYEAFRSLERAGGTLYWHNRGLVGKVPLPVLRAELDLIDSYFPTDYQPRMTISVPHGTGKVHWSQAKVIQ